MTIDPTEAARIAKGLTKAEAGVVLFLNRHGKARACHESFDGRTAYRVHKRGLAVLDRDRTVLRYSLSEFGLAVAEALKAERGA